MSYLPIAKRDIVTPFNIAAGESASLVVTANNKASFARRGGFHYSLTMGIRPYNLLIDSQNYTYWDIVTFLNTNPFFYVPIFNMRETRVFAVSPTITVNGDHLPGDYTVNINGMTGGTATNDPLYNAADPSSTPALTLRPGEFIKFAGKDKVYQVRSHVGNVVTLIQPLVAAVSNTTAVTYKEQLNQAGHPLNGVTFSGVFGKFINEDFGNPINRIEDGILGSIGPLKLKEKL
jgi:hypothetical protein